jgi:hypothetical protein
MTTGNSQDFPELGFFDRVESSFAAIAAHYQQPHRRLLALNWAAKYHGLPSGAFRKAFQLWLESKEGDI